MTTYATHTITLYHREGWSHSYTVENSHIATHDLARLQRLLGRAGEVYIFASENAKVSEIVAMVDVVRVTCDPPITAAEWNGTQG